MSHPTLPSDHLKQAFVSKILWFTLSASQIMYGVVLMGSARSLESRADGARVIDPKIFVILAASTGVASLLLRMVMFSSQRLKSMIPDPTDIEQAKTRLLRKTFVLNVLNWALNESVALFGIVCAFANRDPGIFYPFLAAGLLLNLLMFPSERKLFRQAGLGI